MCFGEGEEREREGEVGGGRELGETKKGGRKKGGSS
jgi:hypothetical protein